MVLLLFQVESLGSLSSSSLFLSLPLTKLPDFDQ